MSYWANEYLPKRWHDRQDEVPERLRLDSEEIERNLESTAGRKRADKRTVRKEAQKAEADNMENER